MYYSEGRKLIYLHNPKCGGTTLGTWLESQFGFRHYNNKSDKVPGTSIIERHRYQVPREFEGYTVFTTFRNPFSRWESFFRYYTQHGLQSGMDFEEFTQKLYGHLPKQSHYLNASDVWIPHDSIECHCNAIGLSSELPPVRHNISDRSIQVTWTPTTIQIVERHFREDLDLILPSPRRYS